MGFQTQIWSAEYLPGGRRPASFPGVGHTRDMVPVLDNDGDTETADWFFSALGFEQGVLQWDNGILQWDDNDGITVCGLFVATLSHHGAPLNLQDTLSTNSRAWQRFANLKPRECVERVGRLVRQWFPDAFTGTVPSLPSAPAFQHHFLGLCTLADWIGSNEIWFKFVDAPDDDYMDPRPAASQNGGQGDWPGHFPAANLFRGSASQDRLCRPVRPPRRAAAQRHPTAVGAENALE